MDKREPLISILIPCYNNQEFIYELLNSIFEQTYHNIEILIGDDASVSFSEKQLIEWLRANKPSWLGRVTVYCNEENVGTVRNIGRLQQESRGDFLLNIAADDALFDSNVLQSFVDYLYELRRMGVEPDVVMGQIEMWDHELKKKQSDFLSAELIDVIKRGTSRDLFARDSAVCCLTAQYFYTRRMLEVVGDLSEHYRLIEDWPSVLRWLRKGERIYYMDACPIIKHRDGGISHGNSLQSQQTFIKFYRELIDCYYNEVEPYDELLTEDEKQVAKKYALDRIAAMRTIYLPRLEKAALKKTQSEVTRKELPEMPVTGKRRIKALLKKNAQEKYIWQFLFWTMLFLFVGEHVQMRQVQIALFAVSCLSLLLALAGIGVKAWQIAKHKLHWF